MSYALIFSGQGSQSVGMLKDVYDEFSICRDIFNQASDAVGKDFWQIAQKDQQELNKTENTQPIMLAAGYSIYKILTKDLDTPITCMAGHSLGEYSALVAANSIDFVDAVKIVSKRAELMQTAVAEGSGAMAAIIGLEDEKIIDICSSFKDGVVEAVNFNSPGQVVIAGDKLLVEKACDEMKKNGARRAVFLPVSVPSHCSLMYDIAKDFKDFINAFDFTSNDKVIHNVDANFADNVDDLKNKIVMQLYKPVMWTSVINNMAKMQVNNIIECGPGKVLTGLTKRIDKSLNSTAVFDTNTINSSIQEIQ